VGLRAGEAQLPLIDVSRHIAPGDRYRRQENSRIGTDVPARAYGLELQFALVSSQSWGAHVSLTKRLLGKLGRRRKPDVVGHACVRTQRVWLMRQDLAS